MNRTDYLAGQVSVLEAVIGAIVQIHQDQQALRDLIEASLELQRQATPASKVTPEYLAGQAAQRAAIALLFPPAEPRPA